MFLRRLYSASACSVPHASRTHTCGQLSPANAGAKIVLSGWLLPERKGKLVSFFQLKDSHGTTQLIVDREHKPNLLQALAALPTESVVQVEGTVLLRPDSAKRPGPTGEIDVRVDNFTLLNKALPTLPFLPSNPHNLPNDELRSTYRYLDLRRDALAANLRKRSNVAHIVRNVLHDQGFLEVETPVLLRSSPEGAREFLVPTRSLSASGSGTNNTSTTDANTNNTNTPNNTSTTTNTPNTLNGSNSNSNSNISNQPTFYALQQSPQQPKQLLICSGAVDKYFQIARCFRDEDGRKDRQPEFTQVDLEMAFVSWGNPHIHHADATTNAPSTATPSITDVTTTTNADVAHLNEGNVDVEGTNTNRSTSTWRIGGTQVRDVVESLIRRIWDEVEGVKLPERFKVMTYHDAMTRYGSDKPDTRYGLEITNITSHLPPSIRERITQSGEVVECIVVKRGSKFIRASNSSNSKGVGVEGGVGGEGGGGRHVERLTLTEDNLTSWTYDNGVVSQAAPEMIRTLNESHDEREGEEGECNLNNKVHANANANANGNVDVNVNGVLKLKPGDDVWISRRTRLPQGGSTPLGRLRTKLFQEAQSLGDYTPSKPHFLWITEFPLFTRADQDKEFLAHGRWSSTHHPFTAPMWEDVRRMWRGEWEEVRGQHYDLVLNGVEIGGGSVRIHDAAMQEYVFSEVLQLNEQEKAPFDHLLHALKCGAPPHGGIALGFDRLMAILCQAQSIRDVIAFPKTSVGTDLLFKSPAPVSEEVLQQYGLQQRTTALAK